MQKIRLKQYIKRYPADTQTPISMYLKFVGSRPGILLESAEVDGRLGRYSLIAWDFLGIITCEKGLLKCPFLAPELCQLKDFSNQGFVSSLKSILNLLEIVPEDKESNFPPITRSLVGYFAYEASGLFEEKLAPLRKEASELSALALPGKQILFDHLHQACVFLSLDNQEISQDQNHEQEDRSFQTNKVINIPGKQEYQSKVEKAKKLIHSGECIQTVLSTRFETEFRGNPFTIYRRLRQANPSPYMFYINFEHILLAGSSPELLIRCTNSHLELRPIAGTRKRGKNQEEDRHLAEEMLKDPKEKAEHVMLVDLGRNDLHRIARTKSLQVEKFMHVERFSHVMHLTTYLSAELEQGLDSLDALKAAFPAGTVTGAPKIRAMEIIHELEGRSRGPYAGAIGWLGLDSHQVNLDLGLTIRSFWIQQNKLQWQAGAGIVSDSVPEKEWQECQNKAKVLLKILNPKGDEDAFADR